MDLAVAMGIYRSSLLIDKKLKDAGFNVMDNEGLRMYRIFLVLYKLKLYKH